MPIYTNDTLFEKFSYSNENDFENIVVELSDQIFGPNTIYLNIKKKIKGNNIGVIPDGYLIDMTISGDPKLYVIENEIVSHDPFKHIGIQMLKFVTSFDDEKIKIRDNIMGEISNNPNYLERLEKNCRESNSRNIDNYLDKAVFSEFKGLVIIDEAKNELYKVLEKINANISVLELKIYKSADGKTAYEFDTLYEEDEEDIHLQSAEKTIISSEERVRRRTRRAESDTIIVPAREDGFKEEFISNNQWYAIRIGAAMKDRIRYIAAYQVAPVSAVTHIAEIKEIKPYKDTGKYLVLFNGPAKEIGKKHLKDSSKSPQGPIYVKYSKLMDSKYLDDAMA
jgi:hypothetical protein